MRIVPISGKKLCRILEKLGFERIYGKGGHVRFIHLDGRKTVVPVHGNELIRIDLLSRILKQSEISRKEYEEMRRKV